MMWMKLLLSKKILEYHDSGFLEGLQDLYLRRGMCQDAVRQTQGEATRMVFSQHAGLYLLLGVGIALCAVLLVAEHCVFKWLVPYWRRQPATSVWKSFSMMFWNQVSGYMYNWFFVGEPLRRFLPADFVVSSHE
jgi:hypothetical protein